jgi:hypothetical protein
MAELSTAETTSDACCAPEQRAACCEPSEKGDCCARESSTCGCSAGQTSDDVDVREQVHERYAAAARAAGAGGAGAGGAVVWPTIKAADRRLRHGFGHPGRRADVDRVHRRGAQA